MKTLYYLFRILLVLTVLPLAAQDNSIRQAFEAYSKRALQEKLYLHTDRSFYIVGESIWFKAYYLDGTTHHSLDVSKVAYIEVLDSNHSPVLQSKIGLKEGKGNGMLVLPTSLQSGNYMLRAYTNWMKNTSPDYFFEKPIIIVNSFTKVLAAEAERKYDVQFFPEGGHLVQNLKSKVAFRAIDESGKGISFSGKIVNQANETLLTFQPERFGLGSFELIPQVGQSYKAVIKDAQGREFTYELPKIQETGYVIALTEANPETLRVQVTSSQSGAPVYLLVHTRQSLRFTEAQTIHNEQASFTIPKQVLQEGISHFTLFDSEKRPLCERLYFKRPDRNLAIQVKSNKLIYGPREKVFLDFNTSELADLSVAVVSVDSLNNPDHEDLYSYLWLTSDLKGTIESPEYYLKHPESNPDLVMLTHGWSRFRWEDIFKPQPFKHVPEYDGHLIFGKVTLNNQPAPEVYSYLSVPGKNIWLYTATSDSLGQVVYQMRHFSGINEVIAQTTDSLHKVELFSPFSNQISSRTYPLFSFNKAHKDQLLNRSIAMQVRNAYSPVYNTIASPDSLTFYGTPDRSYRLDDYTRFPVLEEVMREYVPEVMVRRHQEKFHFMVLDRAGNRLLPADPLVLIDGVPIDINKVLAIDPLKIRQLDIVGARYFLGAIPFNGIVSYKTYKADMGGYQPEGLAMTYEGIQDQREFYAPRYDSKPEKETRTADFRSLLYWKPNLMSNQQLTFYTSDLEGTFRVVVQGITPSGLAGSNTYTFEVKKTL
ncbi:MAG: hypothetical protein QM669_05285 [Siphonobacter sp.]